MPKSFMAQNTVFLLMTALIRNFYKTKGIVVKGKRHLLNFWGFNRCLFVGYCFGKDYTVRISFSLAAKSSSTFFKNLSWIF